MAGVAGSDYPMDQLDVLAERAVDTGQPSAA